MKYRVAGGSKKFASKRQQIRCPGTSGHHYHVSGQPFVIIKDGAPHTIIAFIKTSEALVGQQLDSDLLGLSHQRRNDAAAFCVARFPLENSILIGRLAPGRKTFSQESRADALQSTAVSFGYFQALVFEVTGLH